MNGFSVSMLRRVLAALCAAVLLHATTAAAQTLTLSPSVVPLAGHSGQGITQALTIANHTGIELAFALEAQDVTIVDGQRRFVAPGELPGSIAATAVFTPDHVVVPTGESRTVRVTLTVPDAPRTRAVVALFKGNTRIAKEETTMTASLGTLFTFTLSDRISVAAEPPVIQPQTATSNTRFHQSVLNDGAEPVMVSGVAVVLDADGAIVSKANFNARRALPGEHVTVDADLAAEIRPGAYRVLLTLAYGTRTLTTSSELRVE
jgi:hypothetical protein